jgi:hypothetical protein
MTTEERLEKLERELSRAKRHNRRVLIGAAVCLGMIFAWTFFAQPGRLGTAHAETPTTTPAQNEIRARSFILEDENGKERAALVGSKDGASLEMLDENGKVRAKMSVDKDGSMLLLSDENGKLRAGLSAHKFGAGLVLYDENGKYRAMLGTGKDGPSLSLTDEKGKDRAVLGTTKTETPDGKEIKYPESSILLFGPDGKVRWTAP